MQHLFLVLDQVTHFYHWQQHHELLGQFPFLQYLYDGDDDVNGAKQDLEYRPDPILG